MKKLLSKLFLKIMGWKLVGEVPKEVKKAVMVCAPHTSNWDFPFALASFTIKGLKVNYFIKKSWFFFPMNFLFKATGGVPVDRSKKHGMVDSMTILLKESDEMIVVVPAEGTRSWVPKWKTGFYHIAKAAQVPLLLGFVDFKNNIFVDFKNTIFADFKSNIFVDFKNTIFAYFKNSIFADFKSTIFADFKNTIFADFKNTIVRFWQSAMNVYKLIKFVPNG